MPWSAERLAQGLLQPLDDGVGVVRVADVLQQDDELVTAQPRQDVDVAQELADPAGEGHQQVVAGAVPQAVVHQFEAVDVEVDDREVVIRPALGPLDGHAEMFEKEGPVREPGEGVVEGLEVDLALGVFQFGDVRERGYAGVGLRNLGEADQDVLAVFVFVNKLTFNMLSVRGRHLSCGAFLVAEELAVTLFVDEVQPGFPVQDLRAAAPGHVEKARVGERDLLVLFDDDRGSAGVLENRAVLELGVAQLLRAFPDPMFQGFVGLLQGALGAVDVVHQVLREKTDHQDDADRDQDVQVSAAQGRLEVIIEQAGPDPDDEDAGLVEQSCVASWSSS